MRFSVWFSSLVIVAVPFTTLASSTPICDALEGGNIPLLEARNRLQRSLTDHETTRVRLSGIFTVAEERHRKGEITGAEYLAMTDPLMDEVEKYKSDEAELLAEVACLGVLLKKQKGQ